MACRGSAVQIRYAPLFSRHLLSVESVLRPRMVVRLGLFVILLIAHCVGHSAGPVLTERESRYLQILSGETFEQRADAMVSAMARAELPSENLDLKYLGPFVYARMCSGQEVDRCNEILAEMLDSAIARVPEHGSHTHFYTHSGVHGYLMNREHYSAENEQRLRDFLGALSYAKHSRGTVNMSSMVNASLYLATELWPNYQDADGLSGEEIRRRAESFLYEMFEKFYFHNGCEMDAFTYFSTNLPWVRMLAEYAEDSAMKAKAEAVYQKMLATTLPAWNQGLYIANPYRSKGWHNLYTSQHTMQAISHLGWLLYGNRTDETIFYDKIGGARASLPGSNFWVIYPGKLRPLAALWEADEGKSFPYIYRSRIDGEQAILFKYTYQSQNYGLATQIEEHLNLADAYRQYGYKEIKRTFLEWQSDTKSCAFSVCQDNPERPRDLENRNPIGYGENPYHRVMQSRATSIGVYDVPEDYLEGQRYQMYVPFTQTGIKLRQERDGWVLCHTGSMVFAFQSLEPYVWNQAIFEAPGYDMLSPADQAQRAGGWILETSEITDAIKGETMEAELNCYADLLTEKTKITKRQDYDESPGFSYLALDGTTLEIRFFSPSEKHTDQLVINGQPLALDSWPLIDSPQVTQESGTVTLKTANGKTAATIEYPESAE